MARILSISYEPTLLITRELLLRQLGHTVVSAEGFAQAFKACKNGDNFDLLILGHSIPHDDKLEMISEARKTCGCPVLALLRHGETPLPGIERSIDSWEPQAFMQAVGEMLGPQLVKRDLS